MNKNTKSDGLSPESEELKAPDNLLNPVPGVDFPITLTNPDYTDLPYASLSETQRLDLYLPPGAGPFPLVIIVHGGGFNMGDKSHDRSKPGTDQLLSNRFAVANVNYRLSSEARFPAQVHDLKAAIRWLRAHARKYRLNPDKFAAWGASAGGFLAAMLGTTGDLPILEGYELGNEDQSSRIQAVVDWFGPIDFLKMDEQFAGHPSLQTHNDPYSPESILIGAPIQSRPELVKAANPITYITKNASPFLIQHGTKDTLVPWQQSQMLYDALVPVIGENKVKLTLLKGAGHGGGPQFWEPANVELIIAFLNRHLK